MHVLILGGTGPSGILLIQDALTHNHTVVVYARSPQKLPDAITSNPSVTVVEGQLTDGEKLSEAMKDVHAVLSVLGPGLGHPSNTPLAHGYALVIEVMKKHDVKRLIALGTASITDEHDKFSLLFTLLINVVATFAHNAYKDIVAVEDTIRGQGDELDWTIVRVGLLTHSEKKDIVAGYVGYGKTSAKLARAGLAAFMVEELEANEWVRKAPFISTV